MTVPRIPLSKLQACPGCDLLLEKAHVGTDVQIRCPRCKTVLRKTVKNSLEKAMAISLSGLILFVPAMFLPIMTFSVSGLNSSGNIFDAVMVLYTEGYFFVGTTVLLVSMIFPFLKLSLLFFSSSTIFFKKMPQISIKTLRLYRNIAEWGMVEVFMLGILVSIIKMYGLADIGYNSGFFCFIGLVLLTVISSAITDEEYFWDHIKIETPSKNELNPPATITPSKYKTAREAGLIRCKECSKISWAAQVSPDELMRCKRCLNPLHIRKPNSISKTWAFVLTASFLFLPANLFPIMKVGFMGTHSSSTIMDGIIYFFHDGDFFIGGVILIASVLVPLFKIVGLSIILFSIHFRQSNRLTQKTRMFHFIEFIGRWSFLDIFVIALLATLVQFGALTTIEVNPAAPFFTAVVLASMFATLAFDSRLLWDSASSNIEKQDHTCLPQS